RNLARPAGRPTHQGHGVPGLQPPAAAAAAPTRRPGPPPAAARHRLPRRLATAGATGLVDATRGLEFDTAAMSIELAARGIGVALGRGALVSELLESGRLAAPFELALPAEAGYWLVSPAGHADSPAAAAFRAWVT